MKINPINSYNYFNNNNRASNYRYNYKTFDTVSFKARRLSTPVEKRMSDYAIKMLQGAKLKNGQQVYIKGASYYLPFMEILSREAYKNHSGLVQLDVLEESLEALKKKYNKTQTLDYEKEKIEELKKAGALFFVFNEENDPYKQARVMKIEAKEEYGKRYVKIPPRISKLFKINPKEIFEEALDLHKGQAVQIIAEREQIPIVKKLMQYLFAKNNTEIVDTYIPNASNQNLLLYADEEVLDKIPDYKLGEANEHLTKDIAQLTLYSPNPRANEGIPVDRITRRSQAAYNNYDYAMANYLMSADLPWTFYYAPTTASSIDAYPELADDKLKLIAKAYEDASIINRVGRLKEHIKTLDYRVKKMNQLIEDGYRTFHYVSVNPKTREPDGITDFKVTMSPKSIFKNARFDKPRFNHHPFANVPSEEVFTAPLADSANGKIKATKPLAIFGQTINGLEFEFKNGGVSSVTAETNIENIKNFIESNQNANRLGEVAIVAGSPIAQMNRIFNNILLDENATSHLALGAAFPDTVKGTRDLDPYGELQDYLEKEKINISNIHADFMIGGKNIVITAINDKTGDSKVIVHDDKFLL
ncbi:MAG: aminopeptidase [Cyanobacteria bacterium SIG31]|nr:aminopeptidase [Cyanobacteria bacterium SIG31]